eukprot:12403431-Karenia_brevis.AAC.1
MNGAMLQRYPGLPRGHFPVLHPNTQWTPYEDVTINSKGFALQPHSASKNDSITGRILDKAIVDLGNWAQKVSYATHMNGYIAFSCDRAAHELLLTDMLPPT